MTIPPIVELSQALAHLSTHFWFFTQKSILELPLRTFSLAGRKSSVRLILRKYPTVYLLYAG